MGPQGPAGMSDLPSGAVIWLLETVVPPPGWTRIGTSKQVVKPDGSPALPTTLVLYVKQ